MKYIHTVICSVDVCIKSVCSIYTCEHNQMCTFHQRYLLPVLVEMVYIYYVGVCANQECVPTRSVY